MVVRTQHRQLTARRNGVMREDLINRRASKRCYNLQLKILASKKWEKMVNSIELDLGREAHDMLPSEILVWKRSLGNCQAYAYAFRIVIYEGYYKKATEQQLKKLLMHEMVHSFLGQNHNRDSHGQYFKTCCYLLGLAGYKERPYKWIGRCSECGHKYRKQSQAFSYQNCPECGKTTKTKNRRSKAKLKVRKECPSTQVDASTIDVGEMGSMPQVADSIAPIISMRRTER